MSYCKTCGEQLEGDGYKNILHCPNAEESTYDSLLPDEGPVYCGPYRSEQNWETPCDTCAALPTVENSGLCGPCFFGEADTVGGNW